MTESTVEERLADAIRRRAEADPVAMPDLAVIVGGSVAADLPSTNKGRLLATALAVAFVFASGALLIQRRSQNVDAVATSPSTLELRPTTGVSTTAGREQPPEAVRPNLLPSVEIEVDANVAAPGPLPQGPSTEWYSVSAPTEDFTSEGFELVGAIGGEVVALDPQGGAWVWSPTQSWRRLGVPEGHRQLRIVSNDSDEPLISTFGVTEATGGLWVWSIDTQLDLVDPVQITLPDVPAPAEEHLSVGHINVPMVSGSRQELIVARSFTPRLNLEQLLIQHGYAAEDDRFCDLTGDDDVLRVVMSASAQTDGDCFAAADLRSFEVTAEDLDVPPIDFALEYGSDGQEHRQRTIIYEIVDGGTPAPVHELQGILSEVVVGELGVMVATWGDSGNDRLAQRPSPAAPWVDLELPGNAILSSSIDAGVLALPAETSATVYQLSPNDGFRALGSLPVGWQHASGSAPPAGSSLAIMADTDPIVGSESWAIGLSTTGQRWSWTILKDEFDTEVGRVVITDTHAFLLALPLVGAGATLHAAPLPTS